MTQTSQAEEAASAEVLGQEPGGQRGWSPKLRGVEGGEAGQGRRGGRRFV